MSKVWDLPPRNEKWAVPRKEKWAIFRKSLLVYPIPIIAGITAALTVVDFVIPLRVSWVWDVLFTFCIVLTVGSCFLTCLGIATEYTVEVEIREEKQYAKWLKKETEMSLHPIYYLHHEYVEGQVD